jgi:hypothetical protein
MGVCPRIPETGMVLDNSYGKALWYTVEITNLTQNALSLVQRTDAGGITHRNHVSPHLGRLSKELGQFPRVNEPMCPQVFGPSLPTFCK